MFSCKINNQKRGNTELIITLLNVINYIANYCFKNSIQYDFKQNLELYDFIYFFFEVNQVFQINKIIEELVLQ